jgi:hypothetical protein
VPGGGGLGGIRTETFYSMKRNVKALRAKAEYNIKEIVKLFGQFFLLRPRNSIFKQSCTGKKYNLKEAPLK